MSMSFVSGALMLGLTCVGVVFLRYSRESNDRLFGFFSLAFFMMAVERVLLEVIAPVVESRSFVFLLRLVAFILIIAAIVDKNRTRRKHA